MGGINSNLVHEICKFTHSFKWIEIFIIIILISFKNYFKPLASTIPEKTNLNSAHTSIPWFTIINMEEKLFNSPKIYTTPSNKFGWQEKNHLIVATQFMNNPLPSSIHQFFCRRTHNVGKWNTSEVRRHYVIWYCYHSTKYTTLVNTKKKKKKS